MPAPTSRLAVDLSGSLLRVVDGAPGGPMRCGSGGTPVGSHVGGRIVDVGGVAGALRQLLARAEIRESRALIAVSDALATFRTLRVPTSATDANIDTAAARELPMDPERMATTWVEVRKETDHRIVYACAWDRDLVKRAADVARSAGLEPIAMELKSAAIARAVAEPSFVMLDLSSAPPEIFLVDDHVPQLWYTFDLKAQVGEEVGPALVGPLRQVLRFHHHRRNPDFGSGSPIFIAGDQVISDQVLAELSQTLQHPVRPLPAPSRVPNEVRHGTYLTCLGLLMRRA